MIINHNLPGMNANRQMGVNAANAGKSMEKLSSGLRINRAGDDAAGLAISEKMRGQIRGLDQAAANGQDGISMIQTAEGALGETHSILQRMRELAVQSSNDTNVAVDRSEIQKEMDELAKEVTRIANNTEFNTQKLINGGIDANGIKASRFHVGANAGQDIELSINAMDAKSLNVSRDKVASATGTGEGIVSGATFAGTFGAGVIDGAKVTATYTAGSAGTATAATLEGTYTAAAGDLKFTVDGGAEKTVTFAGTEDIDAAIVLINAQVAGLATKDGTKIVLTSSNTGTGSSIAITTAKVGLTGADIGEAAVPVSAKVTLTSDKGQTQDVAVTATDTSIAKLTTGAFQGMSMTFSAAVSTLADGDDKVVIAAVSTSAAKATFVGGAKTADAVTEAGIDVSTQGNASSAITTIQSAIETVSAERSKLGSYQNRLEHTIANLGTSSENLTSAESRIRDVNMAKEMSTFSKNNILSQAAQAMLAQANQQPQQVLQLLR